MAHVVRQMSPEVRAHLTTAATSLLQAAAGVMAAQQGGTEERRQGVEHIDLDDDGAWDDPPAAADPDPHTDTPTDRPTDRGTDE